MFIEFVSPDWTPVGKNFLNTEHIETVSEFDDHFIVVTSSDDTTTLMKSENAAFVSWWKNDQCKQRLDKARDGSIPDRIVCKSSEYGKNIVVATIPEQSSG